MDERCLEERERRAKESDSFRGHQTGKMLTFDRSKFKEALIHLWWEYNYVNYARDDETRLSQVEDAPIPGASSITPRCMP